EPSDRAGLRWSNPHCISTLAVDLPAATEGLEPQSAAAVALAAQLGANRPSSAAVQRQRQLRVEVTAERVEGYEAACSFGHLQGHVAAEGVDVDVLAAFPGAGANLDRSAEGVRFNRAGHVLQPDP